jgi:integrase
MKGYAARKGDRWYAVIYDGLDPVSGRERRRWHPAGADRADAERLARQLTAEANGRSDEGRSLSFGAYLTARWLPGKRLTVRATTWDCYRRKVDRHILPTLGHVPIRRPPVIRLHDVRHTHATLLIKAGVPVKVVSERLGHATAAFAIETYQHVMPGLQAEAAATLLIPASPRLLPATTSTASARLKRREKTASQR